jgi:Mpv17 / PMP22 family
MAFYAALTAAPNYLFQEEIEKKFPGRNRGSRRGAGTLNIQNTAIKVIIEQTLWAGLNTAFYIAFMGFAKGLNSNMVKWEVQHDFWPLMQAGLKFWPWFSIFNQAVVPVNKRALAGNVAGFGWGIYLNLFGKH